MRTISKDDYIRASQVFHWATKEHFTTWFTGKIERHGRTEVMLPRLVSKGKLTNAWYKHQLVYCAPRRNKKKIAGVDYYPLFEHGLACTEGLVRFWRSDMNGLIIPVRYFRGFGMVPEWGIKYPNGKLLLYEFSTYDNANRPRELKSKLTRYNKDLHLIEDVFKGFAIVVFVLAVSKEKVDHFLREVMPAGERIFFTDYASFKTVPIGAQLTAPIYRWAEDGKEYSLK